MKIPVYINNFNRLTYVKLMLNWLETASTDIEVIIFDNASTYPPLLEWYKQCGVEVVMLDDNYGANQLWWRGIVYTYRKVDWYVATDPDIVPKEDCPKDAIDRMIMAFESNQPWCNKVGFSLEINDLPKTDIGIAAYNWEETKHGFWSKNPLPPWGFRSPIDTTWAVGRRDIIMNPRHDKIWGAGGHSNDCIRLDRPYVARHMSWYIDPDNLTDEERHYMHTCTRESMWTRPLKRKYGLKDGM